MQEPTRPMGASEEALRIRASLRLSQDRKKRPASLRFSQELDELLQWEGLSAIERLAINEFDEDDHLSDTSEPLFNVRRSLNNDHLDHMQDETLSDFSELSTMLESAKKKLESLEGNLRGARDSLLALPSPASTASFQSTRPSTDHTASGSISSIDEEPSSFETIRAQRITSAPLQYMQLRKTPDAGHARYNSDSKITQIGIHPAHASSLGSPVRAPQSPRRQLHKSSMDLLREKAKVLGSVTEDEVRNTWSRPAHSRQASSQASVASTQVLRTQAAGVRRSLQKIKRQSLDLSTLADSSRVKDEVTALEKTLSRQEQAISQLEQVMPQTPERFISIRNASGADKQDEADFVSDGNLKEEYDRHMEHNNSGTRIYEEDTDIEETDHDDTADVFDYEVFILNSALGNYDYEGYIEPAPYQTTKIEAPRKHLPGIRKSKECAARNSFDSDRLVQDNLATMWPQPTVSQEEEKASSTGNVSSVTSVPASLERELVTIVKDSNQQRTNGLEPASQSYASHSPMNSRHSTLDFSKDQDATSVILSALLPAGPTRSGSPALLKSDQSLLFSLATALRETCAALGESGQLDSRERLVAATKLLRGEA